MKNLFLILALIATSVSCSQKKIQKQNDLLEERAISLVYKFLDADIDSVNFINSYMVAKTYYSGESTLNVYIDPEDEYIIPGGLTEEEKSIWIATQLSGEDWLEDYNFSSLSLRLPVKEVPYYLDQMYSYDGNPFQYVYLIIYPEKFSYEDITGSIRGRIFASGYWGTLDFDYGSDPDIFPTYDPKEIFESDQEFISALLSDFEELMTDFGEIKL
jgi:hypothetical protein